MAHGTPHSDETKAAVLAALLTGQSVSAVAREYHIGKTTVLAWRQAAGLGPGSTPVGPQKREEIGDLLYAYLRGTLITLAFQQRHFRDLTWLGSQSAGELAVLHGVSMDKVIRLLEALQLSEPEPEPGSEPGSEPEPLSPAGHPTS